jgi:transcriptional regulator with XRE-family HTH domain
MKNKETKRQKEFLKQIGNRVKTLREKQNLSQIKLSLKISDHYSLISKVELGKNITLSTLLNICDGLEITPQEFFKGCK